LLRQSTGTSGNNRKYYLKEEELGASETENNYVHIQSKLRFK